MWSGTIRILAVVGLATASVTADAQGFRRRDAYGSDDGYAGAFVRGSYIGAPFTRVPRPAQIVPAPWSYGTYGIPTVSGIPAAPSGQPTLTVINARGSKASARRSDASAEDDRPAGVHVIDVHVPRR